MPEGRRQTEAFVKELRGGRLPPLPAGSQTALLRRMLLIDDKGREVARKIRSRHETLSRFFSLFGLDAETQKRDIEGIEHHLSPDTVEVLSDLAKFFEEHPETLRLFQQSRRLAKRKSA